MRKMGKISPANILNCGTCGYDTCRDKAIAIWQGKAEISMCLPYLMEKSERFSNSILDNTPNGILVVNESLEVQDINPAAMKMLNIRYKSDVLGEPVVRLMDPTPFFDAIEGKRPIQGKRSYFAEYGRYLEQTMVYDLSLIHICSFKSLSNRTISKKKSSLPAHFAWANAKRASM